VTVARDLVRYKLDVVAVQEIRGEGAHFGSRGLYFFLWKRKQKHELGTGFLHTIE
jgi:hypothetical protein